MGSYLPSLPKGCWFILLISVVSLSEVSDCRSPPRSTLALRLLGPEPVSPGRQGQRSGVTVKYSYSSCTNKLSWIEYWHLLFPLLAIKDILMLLVKCPWTSSPSRRQCGIFTRINAYNFIDMNHKIFSMQYITKPYFDLFRHLTNWMTSLQWLYTNDLYLRTGCLTYLCPFWGSLFTYSIYTINLN